MIDLTLPLELSNSRYEPRNVRVSSNPDLLRVELYYPNGEYSEGTYDFDRRTGVGVNWRCDENPLRLRPKSAQLPTDHFHVLAGERDWAKTDWVRVGSIDLPSGKEAAEHTKELNAKAASTDSPFRFMVKKHTEMSPVLDYPSWMAFRFFTGEYKAVPWHAQPWAKQEHYAHLSLTDDYLVAFVENEACGQRDTMTVMAPGKYLAKYYSDVLTPTEIQQWAVKVDVEAELKFAHTADEIYAVYTAPNSPSSCMRYHDQSICHDGVVWKSGDSPVRIYGAGDLAVAYLERRGKIVARTLVWPKKKAAGRSYGDITRMRDALTAAGYEFDAKGDGMDDRGKGLLNGARLTLIRHDDDLLTMPYMDLGYGAQMQDDQLVMMRGGAISAQVTGGVSTFSGEDPYYDEDEDDGYDTTCAECGGGVNYDDTYTVNGDQNWCYSCRSHSSSTCDYCDDRFTPSNLTTVYDARDGSPYTDACSSCVDYNDSIQASHSGRWIDTDTAQCCEECETYFDGNASENECPNTDCALHGAAATEEVDA